MLIREQVVAVYREVLGREPREDEIEHQLATVPTLEGLLRVALDSDEYAARQAAQGPAAARTPALVNVFHPDLARWGFPPGTHSEDDVAIVGEDGWLFLCGGTNANLGQYTGAVAMETGWLEQWREVVAARAAEIEQLGVASALLVVPDKLAVYEDRYPEPLDRVGPRPVQRLLEAPGLGVIYPLDELRGAAAAGTEVYMRTDTHLTFRGNELLFGATLGALGVAERPDFSALQFNSYPIAGDLGVKFEPQIVSIVSEPGSLHHATIVEDNREQIAAVDGHIGTRRVFRNDSAPDQRVAAVFGDSFGFAAASYQGIAWFMAQVFREVHFAWVPFGWDAEYVRRVGAEAVLVQGAERFVARVPRRSVDVFELAEETLRRKQAVEVGQIFG